MQFQCEKYTRYFSNIFAEGMRYRVSQVDIRTKRMFYCIANMGHTKLIYRQFEYFMNAVFTILIKCLYIATYMLSIHVMCSDNIFYRGGGKKIVCYINTKEAVG